MTYEEQMRKLIEEERKLNDGPFDDPKIQKLFDKYGKVDVISKIPYNELFKLSLEDRYRLGLVGDYIEYKRQKREQEYGKKHR